MPHSVIFNTGDEPSEDLDLVGDASEGHYLWQRHRHGEHHGRHQWKHGERDRSRQWRNCWQWRFHQ